MQVSCSFSPQSQKFFYWRWTFRCQVKRQHTSVDTRDKQGFTPMSSLWKLFLKMTKTTKILVSSKDAVLLLFCRFCTVNDAQRTKHKRLAKMTVRPFEWIVRVVLENIGIPQVSNTFQSAETNQKVQCFFGLIRGICEPEILPDALESIWSHITKDRGWNKGKELICETLQGHLRSSKCSSCDTSTLMHLDISRHNDIAQKASFSCVIYWVNRW